MEGEFEIFEKKPVTLSEVKSTLAHIQERDGELNFRGNKTVEYLNEIDTISEEDRSKMEDELNGLNIARLRAEIVAKIIDFLPQTDADLDLVMKSFGTVTLPKDQLDSILKVCQNYSK